jgi:alpha-D-ribose 1-methylphosphonate 5-triphosphate synthase subunit PhnI
LHWRAHPIYGKQDDYLERVARNMRLPMSTVRREYDLDFGQSDRSVFGVDLVKRALVMDGDAVEFDEW